MKRELEQYVLVSSPQVSQLLKNLFEKGGEELKKVDVPNLADYSTKYENMR